MPNQVFNVSVEVSDMQNTKRSGWETWTIEGSDKQDAQWKAMTKAAQLTNASAGLFYCVMSITLA